jgi:hypothetical protein
MDEQGQGQEEREGEAQGRGYGHGFGTIRRGNDDEGLYAREDECKMLRVV